MIKSTFELEEKLSAEGYEIIIGIDEVGRGPLAGPVVACATSLRNKYPIQGSTFKIPKVEPLAIEKVYHFDAYRVEAQDILNLGWEEILSPPAGGSKNIIIIELADRIKEIIPADAIWIKFKWLEEDERKITFTKY